MKYRSLTKENMKALDERGQLLAVLVSPKLLEEMLGNRIGPEDSYLVLDSVTTWDDYVIHSQHGREYLVVTPVLQTVRRETEAASGS